MKCPDTRIAFMWRALGITPAAMLALVVSGCQASMPTGFVEAGAGFGYRIGSVECEGAPSIGRVSCEGLIEVWSPERCGQLELDVSGRYASGQEVKRISFPARSVSGNSISKYYPSSILPEATRFQVERLSCMG